LLSLCNRLQKAFAGAAANVDPMHATSVKALQQALEHPGSKSLFLIKWSNDSGKDPVK
jgi:hypothetical protein